MEKAAAFTVTLKTLPGFFVAGMKIRTANQQREIPALWENFVPRMDEIKNHTGEHVSYGAMRSYDPATGEFDYLACLPVTVPEAPPPGMEAWEIPPQTYAVVDCLLSDIHAAHTFFHEEWLPQSGYVQTSAPELELYDARFQPQLGKPEMSLLFPIQPEP